MNEDRAIFIFWPPSRDRWADMEAMLAKKFRVERSIDIVLDSDQVMIALLMDIYMNKPIGLDPAHRVRSYIEPIKEKASLLNGRRIRVIEAFLISGNDVGATAEAVKGEIREAVGGNVRATYRHHLNLHGSDGPKEAEYLAALVLESENLGHLSFRRPVRDGFMDMIHGLRCWCADRGIDRSRVCVVSGGVLEACGVRLAGDLDIIIDDELRLEFGQDGIKDIAPSIDIVASGYHQSSGPVISDVDIIARHHFWMLGIKFAALRIVIETKQNSGRAKDRRDLDIVV